MLNWPVILRSSRPPFLVLTPVCVFAGIASTLQHTGSADWLSVMLVFTAALAAHISVNLLNEYQDFASGLDKATDRTPFSGGSGALVATPDAAPSVLKASIAALFVTTACGFYFLQQQGPIILLPGLAGIALVLTYTRWINRLPLLCLVSPGIAFGPIMVAGSELALHGSVSNSTWLVSLVPFFLVNNLLLLNQLPDIDADARHGRRHLAIRYGIHASTVVYTLFLVLTATTILLAIYWRYLPASALVALPALLPACYSAWGIGRYGKTIARQRFFMPFNVISTLLTPLLIAISLLLA